jgi:catechol 2,3-dioxygenase-like lactoylglutathione lyase family enzyme
MSEATGPGLDSINLVTRDVPKMIDFYERLGVVFPDDTPPPWGSHHRNADQPAGASIDIDSEPSTHVWNEGWPRNRTGVIVGFRVPDRDAVDRTYADLVGAGHPGQQVPCDAFWGARYAIVTDPDGNAVGIMSPADPDRRSVPPDPPG